MQFHWFCAWYNSKIILCLLYFSITKRPLVQLYWSHRIKFNLRYFHCLNLKCVKCTGVKGLWLWDLVCNLIFVGWVKMHRRFVIYTFVTFVKKYIYFFIFWNIYEKLLWPSYYLNFTVNLKVNLLLIIIT